MLKGSLPTLKAEKQNQKKPQEQKQDLQRKDQNEVPKLSGLDLLSGSPPAVTPFRERTFPVSILRKTIVVVCIIFGILLVLNSLLFVYMGRLKTDQNKLTSAILSKADSEKEAINVYNKTLYYKQLLGLRKILSRKTSFVYKNITGNIKLEILRITYTGFEVTAKAENTYDFTKFISDYLSGGYVSEIVLKSASFDPRTKEYEFTIGGNFK